MAGTTEQFKLFNFQDTKNIAVVLTIDGIPIKFSNRSIFTKVRYGDLGIEYGMPDLVYGSFRKVTSGAGFDSI